ncbi:hypothetical protein AcW2_005614 [Taiwanofungus camphoratus]|nr:hypothetical protein AcW2_005614 [Antrodia cinnamomea]
MSAVAPLRAHFHTPIQVWQGYIHSSCDATLFQNAHRETLLDRTQLLPPRFLPISNPPSKHMLLLLLQPIPVAILSLISGHPPNAFLTLSHTLISVPLVHSVLHTQSLHGKLLQRASQMSFGLCTVGTIVSSSDHGAESTRHPFPRVVENYSMT